MRGLVLRDAGAGAVVGTAVGAPLRFAEVINDRDGWQRISRAVEDAVRRLGAAEPL